MLGTIFMWRAMIISNLEDFTRSARYLDGRRKRVLLKHVYVKNSRAMSYMIVYKYISTILGYSRAFDV